MADDVVVENKHEKVMRRLQKLDTREDSHTVSLGMTYIMWYLNHQKGELTQLQEAYLRRIEHASISFRRQRGEELTADELEIVLKGQ